MHENPTESPVASTPSKSTHGRHANTSNLHANPNQTKWPNDQKLDLIAHYLTKTGGLGTINLLIGKRKRSHPHSYYMDPSSNTLLVVKDGQVANFFTGQLVPPECILSKTTLLLPPIPSSESDPTPPPIPYTTNPDSEAVTYPIECCLEECYHTIDFTNLILSHLDPTQVKVCGRCVATPEDFSLMQEIVLCVSFHIHSSIFIEGDKSSWKLEVPSYFDSTICPLLALFKLLKIKPYQKVQVIPKDLDKRKRSLSLEGDSDETATLLPLLKRRKGGQHLEQSNDEQVISKSALNKLVSTADTYNLEEMDPPKTFMCGLRPYQNQALYWMTESGKGIDVEQAAKTLHPCWSTDRICDKRASAIYVNNFS
uniref:Uncharacterized protein n=1 Tax=Nelumbo nucifera TaxID=4432 RepID=A0A822YGK4_NELNU|nr:TPA_asm: hypothetical protein HUJ06_010478 [Nelumbo nucifera]